MSTAPAIRISDGYFYQPCSEYSFSDSASSRQAAPTTASETHVALVARRRMAEHSSRSFGDTDLQENPYEQLELRYTHRVSTLSKLCDADPELAEEVAELTAEQRSLLDKEACLRSQAAKLAEKENLDPGDVYHQLKQFSRTPMQRLRLGLGHGRHRLRIPT